MDHLITKKHLHDLGKLMLAIVMLWAYLSFSQYLIIYSGNLPQEISWYVRRLNGGWGWVGLALLLLHFALPFALLLSQSLKKNPKTIPAIAIFIICIRLVDIFWLVEPNFPDVESSGFHAFRGWILWRRSASADLWLALFFRNAADAAVVAAGSSRSSKGIESWQRTLINRTIRARAKRHGHEGHGHTRASRTSARRQRLSDHRRSASGCCWAASWWCSLCGRLFDFFYSREDAKNAE